jgi:hypothetical protein
MEKMGELLLMAEQLKNDHRPKQSWRKVAQTKKGRSESPDC